MEVRFLLRVALSRDLWKGSAWALLARSGQFLIILHPQGPAVHSLLSSSTDTMWGQAIILLGHHSGLWIRLTAPHKCFPTLSQSDCFYNTPYMTLLLQMAQ